MAAPHQRETRSGAGLRLLRAVVFAAVCVALSAGGHALASCAAVPLWTLGAGFLTVLTVAVPLAGRPRSLPGIATGLALGQLGLHALFGLGQHGAQAAHTAGTAAATTDSSLIERAARLVCGAGAAAISPAEARRILTTAGVDPGSALGPGSGQGSAHAMHHHAGITGAGDAAQSATQQMGLLPDLPMVLGHLLAALAAGWLLRRGDLALLRLFELSAYGIEEGTFARSLRAALALVRALRTGLPGAPVAEPRAPRATRRASWQPRTAVLDDTVIRRGPPASGFELAA
ncbi:hypothetical protein ACFQVC_17605 [Streptomyces monticola]|uniref:Integral membrane protein n=1 Tax=Streptomyces monticola TaxID=2666263 RepID=A0ABW2JK76_9ACTN